VPGSRERKHETLSTKRVEPAPTSNTTRTLLASSQTRISMDCSPNTITRPIRRTILPTTKHKKTLRHSFVRAPRNTTNHPLHTKSLSKQHIKPRAHPPRHNHGLEPWLASNAVDGSYRMNQARYQTQTQPRQPARSHRIAVCIHGTAVRCHDVILATCGAVVEKVSCGFRFAS